jgi:hypothetical protein
MLDCANPHERVEERLRQGFRCEGQKIVISISAADPNDRRAANTARELQHILGDDSNRHARMHRSQLHHQYTLVLEAWSDVIAALHDAQDDAVYLQKRDDLVRLLSRSAPYAALIRAKMRDKVPTRFHALLGLDR